MPLARGSSQHASFSPPQSSIAQVHNPALGATVMLAKQLKEINKAKDLPGISCGLMKENIFEWEVMLMISDDCKYYGGMIFHSTYAPPEFLESSFEDDMYCERKANMYAGGNFRASLIFPPTYPHMPPQMKFLDVIPFHPNVYEDGRVCISILHPPEEDQYGYESASERWSPVQTPETILISVVSVLLFRVYGL